MRRKILIFSFILIILGIILTTGFNKNSGANPKNNAQVKLNSDMSVIIPEDIPDLPVYPNSKIIQTDTIKDGTIKDVGKRYQVIRISSDSVPQISNWYHNELEKTGWNTDIPPADPAANIQLITFTQNKQLINLSLESGPEISGSRITLDYIPNEYVEEGEEDEE
jgi:hypothetical protein